MSGAHGLPSPAMPDRWPFLSARWERLLLVSYAVEPARLEPLLPPGLTLDLRDGQAFVSLVAFDFLDTRVLGVPWPGYRSFPEINLRFYVRDTDTRGVCFVREYVPKRLIAAIARWLYNEPYAAAPMTSEWTPSDEGFRLRHTLRLGGRKQTIEAQLTGQPHRPPADSVEHFFKEHQWGFGTTRGGRLARYEVWHPHWDCLAVGDLSLDWDWGAVYGPQWADLADAEPYHVGFALGSEIRVYGRSVSAPPSEAIP